MPSHYFVLSSRCCSTYWSCSRTKVSKNALKSPHWFTAMQEELSALYSNNTWHLVPRPSNTNIIGSKWVYHIKYKEDGSIDRCKAWLVARGFTQVPRLDYDETFNHVVKPTTIRIILSLTVVSCWTIKQLDIKNAFLHGFLKETMYIEQPPGFVNQNFPNHVFLLNKSLYSLKQAPRAWFERLSHCLFTLGFSCSKAYSSLFIYKKKW